MARPEQAQGTAGCAPDVAILVLSCDKYSDLWPPFFETFFRFWPDVPFPVYLLGNEQTFPHDRVTTLLSGPDRDWSSSLINVLKQIPQAHVMLLIEDAFLTQPVATSEVLKIADWTVQNKASYVRMRASPPPDERVNEDLGRIYEGALYRTSLFTSIWRRDLLLASLREGESAWSFELQGHERLNDYPDFYSTYQSPFTYIHGVEKGHWHRAAVRKLRKMGCNIDLSRRPQFSRAQTALWRIKLVKGHILRLFPRRHQPKVLEMANSAYKFLGLR